ncbi:MAG: efflux RND transporter periplasmic adaptor subunit [Hyphomicrobiaceae bacterium]
MTKRSILGKLLIFPPIVIGGSVLWFAVTNRQPPPQVAIGEIAKPVRVITLAPRNVVPELVGYGSVQPENVWTGVAQVSGRVVYTNPLFRRGATLPAATELIRISPDDYKLAVAESEAQIRSAQAKLDELDVTEQNTTELLRIEEESLTLKQKAIDAKRELVQRGTVAKLSFESELRDLLGQKKAVQDLRNSLRLIPTQKTVQAEQIHVNNSKLETAKLNLKRTSIRLPFNARISSVDVEVSQFVQTGSKIGSADGTASAEITAQYPLDRLRKFFDALRKAQPDKKRSFATRQAFAQSIGLHSIVRLNTGDQDIEWRGRVARLNDTLDEQTRTIGLITVVDAPYAQSKPGTRPPLVKGMFVEVELRANAFKDKLIIPQSAVHSQQVYVAGKDNRLEIRKVELGYEGDNYVILANGVSNGERIVVSDLATPSEGMLLEPSEDDDLKTRLATAAAPTEIKP